MLYVESSAALAWLLGEPTGETVRKLLAAAAAVGSSDLTLVECDRTLVRALATGRVREAEAIRVGVALVHAASRWHVLALSGGQLARARRPFPAEPIRTLDALHLAAALQFERDAGPVTVLSLDDRVRTNGRLLGLRVAPEDGAA